MNHVAWIRVLACCCTMAVLVSIPAPAQLPDSPTGRMARALAELIADPDAEALERFIAQQVAPAAVDDGELRAALDRLSDPCAGGRMTGAEKSGPATADLSFEHPDGGCRVRYEIESAPPHRLLSLAVEVIGAGPAAGSSSRSGAAGVRPLVDAFVAAFNSGNADRMLAFYERHATESFRSRRSDDDDRALYERLYGDMGTISLKGLRVEADGRLRASFSSARLPEPVVFEFAVQPQPPHRIDGFSVHVGERGEDSAAFPPLDLDPAADDATLARALDDYFRRLAGEELFSGSVLVARGGKPVFKGAYGLANRDSGVKNSLRTRFDVGSITKLMTKVAVGQLARDGKLGLDDALLEHLPDYPDREAARKITLRQLLEHSSGLGDIFNESWDSARKDRLLAPRDFFPLFTGRSLLFEPGQGRRYSNAGYIVLGAVVEAVSGQPFDRYLQQRIFDPAGMRASGFPRRDGTVSGLAIGYTRRGPAGSSTGLTPNLGMLPIKGCPAGSSSHTAEDLWKFDRALRAGKLLGPGWTDWVFTGVVPDESGTRASHPTPADHPIGVAGGGPGVSALLESDGDTAVIVLANIDEPSPARLGLMLARKISGG